LRCCRPSPKLRLGRKSHVLYSMEMCPVR
jgi:hypothetical protein